MDKNIKIILQYDGSRYDGWQKQGNTDLTIQGKLEAILEKMTGQPVEVHGAGRTDAGVHALSQVANFHIPESFFAQTGEYEHENKKSGQPAAEFVKQYLNRYLPDDIAVLSASEAEPRFHSRLNAVSKIYRYHIETADKKNVFERKYIYGFGQPLNVNAMRKAAEALSGTRDFKAFSSQKKVKKSTVRTLTSIGIEEKGTEIVITYEGSGFLYNMVRILTGTLIEAGRGQKSLHEIEQAFETGERALAGKTAPAEGLFLTKVTY